MLLVWKRKEVPTQDRRHNAWRPPTPRDRSHDLYLRAPRDNPATQLYFPYRDQISATVQEWLHVQHSAGVRCSAGRMLEIAEGVLCCRHTELQSFAVFACRWRIRMVLGALLGVMSLASA